MESPPAAGPKQAPAVAPGNPPAPRRRFRPVLTIGVAAAVTVAVALALIVLSQPPPGPRPATPATGYPSRSTRAVRSS
jgi:hypothetical protein